MDRIQSAIVFTVMSNGGTNPGSVQCFLSFYSFGRKAHGSGGSNFGLFEDVRKFDQ